MDRFAIRSALLLLLLSVVYFLVSISTLVIINFTLFIYSFVVPHLLPRRKSDCATAFFTRTHSLPSSCLFSFDELSSPGAIYSFNQLNYFVFYSVSPLEVDGE